MLELFFSATPKMLKQVARSPVSMPPGSKSSATQATLSAPVPWSSPRLISNTHHSSHQQLNSSSTRLMQRAESQREVGKPETTEVQITRSWRGLFLLLCFLLLYTDRASIFFINQDALNLGNVEVEANVEDRKHSTLVAYPLFVQVLHVQCTNARLPLLGAPAAAPAGGMEGMDMKA